MAVARANNGKLGYTVNDSLVFFRESSVLRGPTQSEFAATAGFTKPSASQLHYRKLEDVGWIALMDPENPLKGYVLTPAGERRYRELVTEENRKGPTWPVE